MHNEFHTPSKYQPTKNNLAEVRWEYNPKEEAAFDNVINKVHFVTYLGHLAQKNRNSPTNVWTATPNKNIHY